MPSYFPSQDLTLKYISSSYQDVNQKYLDNNILYILDGLGNVLFSLPSSSIGSILITSDITSSMSVATASYAVSQSYITNYQISSSYASASTLSQTSLTADFALLAGEAIHATSASVAIASDFALLAGEAIHSTTSSYANTSSLSDLATYSLTSVNSLFSDTASLAINSIYTITASYALNGGGSGTSLTTGSTYPITASVAITASYALNGGGGGPSISSSYAQTASYLNGYNGIAIPPYDYSYIQYNGPGGQFSDVTYKLGGASGSIVCILTAIYSGAVFTGVSKSLV